MAKLPLIHRHRIRSIMVSFAYDMFKLEYSYSLLKK